MIKNKTIIRVRYADTDKMQIVYNGKYLEYFEVGRTELLRSVGLPYNEVEKHGYQLPLIEAGVKYKSPAFYDDLLEIESTNNSLYSAKVKIEYIIRRKETGEIVTEGFTEHVFVRVEDRKPVRPPKFYIDSLAEFFEVDK
ncbi:MAG: acyl-CoA thioesterase [Melioribacteraceae bacterium]|nr:acyl-CoA thioesterase [Melioribacteraceae bacterium]MCF8355722.1 acyl-CoA thioesterase [Melioribacteraceae bacterium]MCF8393840.1 acyl-CoA thioesterase [Melioribacteraceae bacterium]MCF8418213.1 acyl-CoA thioesterase [Melioribacteraceae bacterium]